MFFTADFSDIVEGRITDVYFQRSMAVLKAENRDPEVRAEFTAKSLPHGWRWAVLTGLSEAVEVMRQLNVRVRALREGSVFYPYEPVMEIEGRYQAFCVFETALLGFLCQASGISTQAARMKRLAAERLVISFGARRMHPVLAPMIERNAYVGGCDGVSVVKSGELIGKDPIGTMPHALVLCMGSTVEAVRAYDRAMGPNVRLVALIDTLQDEKFEALNVAGALGKRLYAVRFDTPASRRGSLYRILEETRWELDLRGHEHVKFFVSGGILEEDISVLNPLVHGYGIGTSISNAPVIDFAMDIVEIEGKPVAKRGKWSGSKSLFVCEECGSRRIAARTGAEEEKCSCGGTARNRLAPVLDDGRLLVEQEAASRIRSFVLEQAEGLEM